MTNPHTTLQLTDSQRSRLRDFERKSFDQYCKRMGYDPRRHEAYLLGLAKDELRHIIQTIDEANEGKSFPEAHAAAMESLEASDWWSFKRLQQDGAVSGLFDQLADLASTLPIDWEYLRRIATEFGLDPPMVSTPASLSRLLSAIPHIYQYGNNFNAFVAREAVIDDLPCICVYEHLISASQSFLDVVMRQVLRRSDAGQFTVADESAWDRIGSQPGFVTECRSVLEMVLARTDRAAIEPDYLLSRSWPEMQLSCRLLFNGATSFVRLHEYGHLLRGHLRQQQTHRLEFEADEFAYAVVAAEHAEFAGASFWSKLGALGLLVMIALIEMIERQPPSTEHPPAQERLAALMRDGTAESINLFVHVRAMLGVCRKTVESGYGVRYRY